MKKKRLNFQQNVNENEKNVPETTALKEMNK